jgi:hypothetical protein
LKSENEALAVSVLISKVYEGNGPEKERLKRDRDTDPSFKPPLIRANSSSAAVNPPPPVEQVPPDGETGKVVKLLETPSTTTTTGT